MSEYRVKETYQYCDEMGKIGAKSLKDAEDMEARDSVLIEAETIINGERQADYSDPIESFNTISKIASAIIGRDISATECCKVMMAVKHARQQFKHKRDNQVDLAGYSEILNRLEEYDTKTSD